MELKLKRRKKDLPRVGGWVCVSEKMVPMRGWGARRSQRIFGVRR